MTDKHTQCAEILRYVQEHGSITTLEAAHELLIMNFTARISDLRRRGVIVTTEDITKKNHYGRRVTYKRYYIVEANR